METREGCNKYEKQLLLSQWFKVNPRFLMKLYNYQRQTNYVQYSTKKRICWVWIMEYSYQ